MGHKGKARYNLWKHTETVTFYEFQIWPNIKEGKLPERFTKEFPAEVWDFNTLFQFVYLLIKKNVLIFNFSFAGIHNQKDAFRTP